MKGVTALTKIRVRTKQLQKKHPGKKYKTLQKQAAAEYRAGSIPKARKKPAKRKAKAKVSGHRKYKVTHRVKRVGAVKHKRKRAPRKAKAPAKVRVIRRTVTKYKRVGAARGGSMMKTLLPIALVAGVGLLAYMAFNKSDAAVPPLQLTGNATRDNSAQNILAYATAAGLGINALTALLNAINSMSDSQVISTSTQVSSGMLNVGAIAPPTGGGSITPGTLQY